MRAGKRLFQVFVGYGREDVGPVSEFYHALCASGTEAWMDIYALRAGEEWQLAIREALRASQLALLFLSRRTYMRSGYLHTEIHEGVELARTRPPGQIFLLPVLLDRCPIHPRLQPF